MPMKSENMCSFCAMIVNSAPKNHSFLPSMGDIALIVGRLVLDTKKIILTDAQHIRIINARERPGNTVHFD